MLYRNDSSKKLFIVSVDGNIGSGKTTFVENIKTLRLNTTYQKIIFLQEPVDEWDTIRDNNKVFWVFL